MNTVTTIAQSISQTTEQDTVMNTTDMILLNIFNTLSNEEIQLENDARIEKEVQAVLEDIKREGNNTLEAMFKHANGYRKAVQLLQQFHASSVDTKDVEVLLLCSMVQYTSYWDMPIDTAGQKFVHTPVTEGNKDYIEGRKSRKDYYIDVINYFMKNTKNAATLQSYMSFLADFKWGLTNIHAKYRLLDDVTVEQKFKSEEGKKHILAKKELKIPQLPVKLDVTRNGVYIRAAAKTVFEYHGTDFVSTLTRHHSYLLTAGELEAGLFSIHDRVRLHTKEVVYVNGSRQTHVSVDSVEPKGSILNKILLLKASKIDYSKLLEESKKDYLKICSISPKGRIEVIPVPTELQALKHTYLNTGLVGASEATAGYVAPLKTVPGLAALITANNVPHIYTVEEINKAMARHQKLDLGKGWDLGKVEVNVVFSLTHKYNVVDGVIVKEELAPEVVKKAVADLGPSTLLCTDDLLERIGLCRVTSTMDQGGLKCTTNYSKKANKMNVVGPNAFKGGILNAALIKMREMGKDIPLEMLAKQGQGTLDQLACLAVNQLETIEFNGYEVQVLKVNVDIKITNAYTVEAFRFKEEDLTMVQEQIELQETIDTVVSSANQRQSAMRDYILNRVVTEPSFKAMKWIEENLANGNIVRKELDTRVSSSAHQVMNAWHGMEGPVALIRELINGMSRKDLIIKETAVNLLKGRTNRPIARVNAETIAEILINNCSVISENVNTYPEIVLEEVNRLLGNPMECYAPEFIEIRFGDKVVKFPAFSGLFYVEQQVKTPGKILATGLFKELLTAVKDFITSEDKHTIATNSIVGAGHKFEAIIQSQLLGKSFGYLPGEGTYVVAINPIGEYDRNISDVYTTNPQILVNRAGRDVTQALRSKYPLYHKLAAAKVGIKQHDFGSSLLNMIFEKAGIVTAEHMFSHLDDFDGDLFQLLLLSDETLDLFNDYSDAYDAELGAAFRKGAIKEGHASIKHSFSFKGHTMTQVQDAIIASATASRNIGFFTATSYKLGAAMEGMDVFTTVTGTEVKLTSHCKEVILNFINYLCQVESMDNMKQKGSSTTDMFIMECIAPNNIKKLINGVDEQEVPRKLNEFVTIVGGRLQAVIKEEGFDLPLDFGTFMAEVVLAVGLEINTRGTHVINIFSDSYQTRRYTEVMEGLSENAGNVGNEYNLINSFISTKSSADSKSMYNVLLKELAAIRTMDAN